MHRRIGAGDDPSGRTVDRSLIDTARGDGSRSLPARLRRNATGVVGGSASKVRLFTGPASADAAADLGAQAFTLGRDVFFGAGEYRPGTPSGDDLIAHEVAHAGESDGVVHRKLNFDADRFNKARSIKGRIAAHQNADMITSIKRLVREYDADDAPWARVDRLNRLSAYIDGWTADHEGGESSEERRFANVLDDLRLSIEAERSRIDAEDVYLDDETKKRIPRGLKEPGRAYENRIKDVRTRWQQAARELGMSEAEYFAIWRYKGEEYAKINPAIANSKEWMAKMQQGQADSKLFAEGSTHATMFLPLLHRLPAVKGQFWRGYGVEREVWDRDYRLGAKVSFPQLLSISKKQDVADGFARDGTARDGIGVTASVRVKSARNMGFIFGEEEKEGELVCLPGTQFKITYINETTSAPLRAKNKARYQVQLEEI